MKSYKATILYAEDDATLAYITRDNLEQKGYMVESVTNGYEALYKFSEMHFDICIFDVMMPKLDGFSLAAQIREKNADIPIIFLTAKSAGEDKITGLKTGADDYITKPFSIDELVLKIEIFLRRRNIYKEKDYPEKLFLGSYIIDFKNQQLLTGDHKIKLTYKENELLKLFSRKQGEIIRREEILISLWGGNDYFAGRSLDVFISRLRKYLKEDKKISIENIHSIGFRLEVKNTDSI